MKGPSPKPTALLRRRNRPVTAAELDADDAPRRAPTLPKGREWRAETRDWWRDLWRSPMAAEYVRSDRHGLLLLADLIDRYWERPSTALAGEIRQQSAGFGLTPLDRRRLQWDVRAAPVAPAARPSPVAVQPDPRGLLSVG